MRLHAPQTFKDEKSVAHLIEDDAVVLYDIKSARPYVHYSLDAARRAVLLPSTTVAVCRLFTLHPHQQQLLQQNATTLAQS